MLTLQLFFSLHASQPLYVEMWKRDERVKIIDKMRGACIKLNKKRHFVELNPQQCVNEAVRIVRRG